MHEVVLKHKCVNSSERMKRIFESDLMAQR